MRTKYYRSILLLVIIALDVVECGYRLEVRVNRYKNPSHLQADGACCQHQFTIESCSPCSNRFFFCLQRAGTNVDNIDMKTDDICPEAWLSHFTGLVGQDKKDPDDISFEGEAVIDQLNNIPNPLVFTSDDSWPGDFQLVVAIRNRRSIFDEYFVDFMLEDWKLQGDEYQFASTSLEGVAHRSTLTVSARVLCTKNTHGPKCNETIVETICPETDLNLQAKEDALNSSKTLNFIESGYYELVVSLSVVGATVGLLITVAVAGFISYFCYAKKKKRMDDECEEQEPFLKQSTGDADSPRYCADNTRNRTVEDQVEVAMDTHVAIPAGGGMKDEQNIDSLYSIIRKENLDGYVSEELLDDVEEESEEKGKWKEEKGGKEVEREVEQSGVEDVKEVKGGVEDVKEVKGGVEDEKEVNGGMEDVKEVNGGMEDVKEVNGGMEDVKEVKGGVEDEKEVNGGVEDVKEVKGGVEDVKEVKGGVEDEEEVKGGVEDEEEVNGGVEDEEEVNGGVEDEKEVKGGITEDEVHDEKEVERGELREVDEGEEEGANEVRAVEELQQEKEKREEEEAKDRVRPFYQ